MKVGRNDICPCGSGKKFKKCCIHLDFENPEYPTQIFGYDKDISKDPLCMVSNITSLNKSDIEKSFNNEFPIGSWFISFGSHEEITLYGPYESMDFCMKLGLEMFPTITFTFPNEMI